MRRRLVPERKAPLGLAAFLALPILFASLMAVSLAIEKPRVVEWKGAHGNLNRLFHDPTGTLEAKIWLLSFVPALLLLAVGWAAAHLRYGIYVTCVAAIVIALGVTARIGVWERHHTARFPYGEDLLADQTNSSSLARGQWEDTAGHTATTLAHYAIALALASAAIATFVAWRRRRGTPPLVHEPPVLATGGAPQIVGGESVD